MHHRVQYVSLNDAAAFEPSLAPGTTEVWYQKPKYFGAINVLSLRDDNRVPFNPANLSLAHVKLGSIIETDPDIIFGVMQGENWSPYGNARALISSLGLGHTSMSMGDCIKIGGVVLICKARGWLGVDVPD